MLKSHDLLHRVTDSYDAKTNVRAVGVAGRQAEQAAVAEANAAAGTPFVTYVDQVQARFHGHEPGPRPSHPNSERWLREAFDTRLTNEWYHANDKGHTAYSNLLRDLGDLGASHPRRHRRQP